MGQCEARKKVMRVINIQIVLVWIRDSVFPKEFSNTNTMPKLSGLSVSNYQSTTDEEKIANVSYQSSQHQMFLICSDAERANF